MENLTWLPALTTIESLLRILVSLTVIAVGFRAIRALNLYIDRNSK